MSEADDFFVTCEKCWAGTPVCKHMADSIAKLKEIAQLARVARDARLGGVEEIAMWAHYMKLDNALADYDNIQRHE